jgi:DNA replication protein DnaC
MQPTQIRDLLKRPFPRRTSAPRQPSTNGDVGDPNCPVCKGIGYIRKDVPVGHPDFGEAFPCPQCRANLSHSLQRFSQLTEKEGRCRLEDISTVNRPATKRVLEACRAFLGSPDHILTIHGRVGTGKTMVAHAVFNDLLRRGISAVYVRLADMLDYIREAYDHAPDDRGPGASRRLHEFAEAPVLIIDEFDKVNITPWVQERLELLVDRRHRLAEDGGAGTILVMNSDPARQCESIASRLLAGCNRVVNNDDTDIRSALER